jgi:hypothetical protein
MRLVLLQDLCGDFDLDLVHWIGAVASFKSPAGHRLVYGLFSEWQVEFRGC